MHTHTFVCICVHARVQNMVFVKFMTKLTLESLLNEDFLACPKGQQLKTFTMVNAI